MRIALVATLALLAIWFVALRPKPPAAESPAPQVAAPAQAAATPSQSPAAKPAPVPEPAPAEKTARAARTAPGDPSSSYLRDLERGRAVVLLFWDPKGAEDRAVRDAVRDVASRGGKVARGTVDIKDVGAYEAITTGVQVLTAPTVLVIGPDRQARSITGFTDVAEIDQAVGDALRR